MTSGERKARVLLISQYYPPEITAAAFRMGGLADFLSQNGYAVTVLTTTPHKSSAVISREEQNRDLKIIRVPVTALSHLGQYLQFVFRSLRRIRELSRQGKQEALVASSPPLSVFLIGRVLSAGLRVPLILDVRDLWPDTPAALGRLSRRGPVFHLFKLWEKRSYRRAAAILCVARPMAERIRAHGTASVTVVYNGVARSDLDKARLWPVISPPAPGDAWQIVYFGNLGLAQGLDILLEAGERLDPGKFNVHMVGDGVRRNEIIQAIRLRGLHHFHVHPVVPREELLRTVATKAHLLFFNLSSQPVFLQTIPSKLFDYLLFRRPIVAGIGGEGEEILRETGSAVLFEGGSSHSLVSAFNQAGHHWRHLTKQAVKCNLDIAKGYVREDQFARAANIIDAVLPERKPKPDPGRSN